MFEDKEKEAMRQEIEYLKKLVDSLLMKIGVPPVAKPAFNIKTEVRPAGEEVQGTGPTTEQYGD